MKYKVSNIRYRKEPLCDIIVYGVTINDCTNEEIDHYVKKVKEEYYAKLPSEITVDIPHASDRGLEHDIRIAASEAANWIILSFDYEDASGVHHVDEEPYVRIN